ncbi:MAG: 2TM domain-containing protein [Candidatus Syntrophoarchaeum sp.]|nr:2TM domain-containing protein [Candidatus Syntrophoarchaeum sp.]
MSSEIEDYKEARRKVEKKDEKIGFFIHLGIYLVFNALIFPVINLVYTPEDLWFHYPIIIWGIGIFGVHLPLGLLLFDRWYNKQEEKIKELLKREK